MKYAVSGIVGTSAFLWTLGALAQVPPPSTAAEPAAAAPAPAPAAPAPAPAAAAPVQPAPAPAPPVQPGYAGAYPAGAEPAPGQPAPYPQPAPGQAPPPAGYYIVQPMAPMPMAPPPPDPTAKLHDGFFLRMSLGFGPGYLNHEVKSDGVSQLKYDFSGTAVMFDLMLGGSPTPGLVLGGLLMGHQISGLSVEDEDGNEMDVASDVKVTASTLGGFVNFYPDPKGGLNLHALVGFGTRSFSDDNDTSDSDSNPSGIVVGGGIGYDFWVSDQWSIGPNFRFTYMNLTKSESGAELTESLILPTLAFAATYH